MCPPVTSGDVLIPSGNKEAVTRKRHSRDDEVIVVKKLGKLVEDPMRSSPYTFVVLIGSALANLRRIPNSTSHAPYRTMTNDAPLLSHDFYDILRIKIKHLTNHVATIRSPIPLLDLV